MGNMTHKLLVLIAVVILGLCTTACKGGSSVPDENGTDAFLSGDLTVTGAPLADLDDPASVGELDADKWALRVIDPTESVDSAEIPNEDTSFGTVAVQPLDNYLLQIELLPAVDLSGSTADVTPLTLDIAIPEVEGVETQVSTEVELVAPIHASSLRTTSQTGGWLVRLRYTIGGPREEMDAIEIDWNHHQMRRDINGNGNFDDDPVFQDSDRNGISDNRQQGMMDNQMHGSSVQASGLIDQIDVQLGRVTIDGRVFLVDESTQITDSGGQTLTLSDLSVGQSADAEGRKGRMGSVYATSIVLSAGQ